MNDTYTPASLYAGLIGGVLVIAGILGFFYSSSFGAPGEVSRFSASSRSTARTTSCTPCSASLGSPPMGRAPRGGRRKGLRPAEPPDRTRARSRIADAVEGRFTGGFRRLPPS